MYCERHPLGPVSVTDLVITKVGPNRVAVMAALRGMLDLSPAGAGELVRGGVPITVPNVDSSWMTAHQLHLAACGAVTERVTRVYCSIDADDGGAIA